ncbi:MAG: hypothetical protein ACOC2Q_01900 [Spirochaetota bacterium]
MRRRGRRRGDEADEATSEAGEFGAAGYEDGELKAELSQEGEYGMVEETDAIAPWHEQAQAAEQWLIENQDIGELELDDEGRPDAISGATIRVGDFKARAAQALEGHSR